MSLCASLIEDNIGYLQQATDLLHGLSDEVYLKPASFAFGSGLGAHLRHCLEHYESFLAGMKSGAIDYDARPRDAHVEHDRAYALHRIDALRAALRELSYENEEERWLKVKQDSNAHEAAPGWSRSTLARELQFLVSHTVHHYALIAVILRLHGLEPYQDFGVAPSTLKYRQATGS